jgi:hypothetical protein
VARKGASGIGILIPSAAGSPLSVPAIGAKRAIPQNFFSFAPVCSVDGCLNPRLFGAGRSSEGFAEAIHFQDIEPMVGIGG